MSKRNIAIIQILTCSALWSIAGIFIKLIPWNSFVIAGIRSLIAGAVAYTYMRIKKLRFAVNRRTVAAGASLWLTMTFFVTANKLTTAANAIVLQFTAPVFIMLISGAFLGKKFARADIITVIVTLAGISLFFFDQLGGGKLFGNIIGLLSGVTFACYYISLGASPEHERISAVVLGDLMAFAAGIPFIFTTAPEVSGSSVLCILILGVFQLGIPYVLLAKGSEYCPPLACSLLGALEPLLNPVWVFIFDGEAPGVFALIGGAIVIVSISLWCVYGDRKDRKASREG